jgi:hypothetical protein
MSSYTDDPPKGIEVNNDEVEPEFSNVELEKLPIDS